MKNSNEKKEKSEKKEIQGYCITGVRCRCSKTTCSFWVSKNPKKSDDKKE